MFLKRLRGLDSALRLGVGLDVDGDAAADLCLDADSVHGLLHLAMAAKAVLNHEPYRHGNTRCVQRAFGKAKSSISALKYLSHLKQ